MKWPHRTAHTNASLYSPSSETRECRMAKEIAKERRLLQDQRGSMALELFPPVPIPPHVASVSFVLSLGACLLWQLFLSSFSPPFSFTARLIPFISNEFVHRVLPNSVRSKKAQSLGTAYCIVPSKPWEVLFSRRSIPHETFSTIVPKYAQLTRFLGLNSACAAVNVGIDWPSSSCTRVLYLGMFWNFRTRVRQARASHNHNWHVALIHMQMREACSSLN